MKTTQQIFSFILNALPVSLLSDSIECKREKSKRVDFLFGFLEWKGQDSPCFQLKRFNDVPWIIY